MEAREVLGGFMLSAIRQGLVSGVDKSGILLWSLDSDQKGGFKLPICPMLEHSVTSSDNKRQKCI